MSGFTLVATPVGTPGPKENLWSGKRASSLAPDPNPQFTAPSIRIKINKGSASAIDNKPHHNSPRASLTETHQGFRHKLSLPQPDIGGDLLRGSELEIARQYTNSGGGAHSPAPNIISPFSESRRGRRSEPKRQSDWSRRSGERNVPGTSTHYTLYMRRLQQRQIHDQLNQSQRINSSIRRVASDRRLRSQTAPVNHPRNSAQQEKLCNLTETWDTHAIKTLQQPSMDIRQRKQEFVNELAFKQEQNRHLKIRTSVTPREDEGLLDWLQRSVTAVPLDSKYAPRNTDRLFSLSVHGLQNRLTGGGGGGSSRQLFHAPQPRDEYRRAGSAQRQAAAGVPGGGGREVRSAAARLNLHQSEDAEERVETSRRLWSSHHCSRYAHRKTMPEVRDEDLAFDSGVISEFSHMPDEQEDSRSDREDELRDLVDDCLTPSPSKPSHLHSQ